MKNLRPFNKLPRNFYTRDVITVAKELLGKNISEISSVSVADTLKFFEGIKLSEREKIIAGKILNEVKSRLKFLDDVGLGYLTLARSANTLAGGETQRIRLASQIGSQLVGVLYILDEPTTGLHFSDLEKLLQVLHKLTQLGNTVIVIEHNLDIIKNADWIIDLGPEGGDNGGEIIGMGTPQELRMLERSYTGTYLKHIL